MSPAARLATVLAGLAAIVIAFFVLQPTDEPAPVGAQPAATTAASAPATGTTGTTTPAEPPQPEVPALRIRDGGPVGGLQEIEAEKGDTVRIRITTDAPHELHLHGYDKYVDVTPDRPTTLRFEATLDGRFELENHDNAVQLAQVSIFP